METQKEITSSIFKGTVFKPVFNHYGLMLDDTELQKTTVLALLQNSEIGAFVSFTVDKEEQSMKITHECSTSEESTILHKNLEKYCVDTGINTIVVSIPRKARGFLASYKRAGFKKLCNGIAYINGVIIAETYDCIKELN